MKEQLLHYMIVIIIVSGVVGMALIHIPFPCDCGCPELKPNEICGNSITCTCLAPLLVGVILLVVLVGFLGFVNVEDEGGRKK
jgi:hypothetical protein